MSVMGVCSFWCILLDFDLFNQIFLKENYVTRWYITVPFLKVVAIRET
jgi:hypothetical protein